MVKSAAQIEKERHEASIKMANEIAQKARQAQLEHGWDYERAAEYVRFINPECAEIEAKGYISEQPAREYSKTSYEAATELADLTKKKMRREKLTYEIAQAKVFEENPQLVEVYAKSD
jgi:hypothetical protein